VDLGLAGRAYVVTGGTRGLGLATARVLTDEGASVLVSSRDPANVSAALADLGPTARGMAADNAADGAADELVHAAVDAFGRLDGVLVSVGGPPPTSALDATDEQWRTAFDAVVLGAVRVVRAAVPHLEPGGAVALVLSSSVRQPIPGLAISNGLRPGLAMWAKGLADELGPRGLRVVGLLPGRVLTDRMRSLAPGPEEQERQSADIPLRRFGDPAEFGRVAAFVLSPAASYLTGCFIPVDGGALRPV
jgi:3-oxoacyl-[acyl-carrier protein] reductase